MAGTRDDRTRPRHRHPRAGGRRWYENGVATGWRASTAADYKSGLSTRLLPDFGHLPIGKITERRVEVWLETARKELSPRSCVKLLFIGTAIFKRAHHDYPGFTGNPFGEVERALKPEDDAIEVFTNEEALAIVRRGPVPSAGR